MLLVVEKSLSIAGGHERTQIAALKSFAAPRELLVVTARGFGKGARFADWPPVRAVLSTRRRRQRKPDIAVAKDVSRLRDLLSKVDGAAKQRPAVVIPTAETHDLRVCLGLLEQAPQHIRYGLRILSEAALAALTEAELSTLRGHIDSGRVHLATETASLSRRLRATRGINAPDDFVLPCTLSPDNPASDDREDLAVPDGMRRLRLGFFGGLRKEKGVRLLPDIVRNLSWLIGKSSPRLRVEVFIARPRRGPQDRERWRFDLALWWGSRGWLGERRAVTLCRTPAIQPAEDFRRHLQSIDLILLPYDRDAYRFRGSGVIIDGVLAGKPFVHTEGMGMEDLLGLGNAESATSAEEFASKILLVLRQTENYRAGAEKARAALLAQFRRSAEMLRSL
jgi:hypothetical protein